jgi:hypothetical protein
MKRVPKQTTGHQDAATVIAADDGRPLSLDLVFRRLPTGICGSCCGIGIDGCRCARVLNELHVRQADCQRCRSGSIRKASGDTPPTRTHKQTGQLTVALLAGAPADRRSWKRSLLAPWASRRHQDRLDVLDQLTPKIQELTRAPEDEVPNRPVTRLLGKSRLVEQTGSECRSFAATYVSSR